jgi:hypothetical protein
VLLRGPVCRLLDWGLLPFVVRHATHPDPCAQVGVTEMFTPPISLAYQETKFGNPYAISSITGILILGITDRMASRVTVQQMQGRAPAH